VEQVAAKQVGRWREMVPVAVGTFAVTFALWLLSYSLDRGEPGAGMIAGRAVALPVHLVGALIALPLGAFVLWRPKGTATHKMLGRLWVAVMMVVAISSYWLRTLSGGFSFIHLLSVLTIVSLPLGIMQARRGNIPAHLRAMRGVYIGLVVAGLFALAPQRTLGGMLFGG
jgi:uncharacterized membrane protein